MTSHIRPMCTTEPGSVTSLIVTSVPSQPDSLRLSWEAPRSPCPADDYLIEYQLDSLEQCNETDGQRTLFTTTTYTFITVTGLEAHSTYRVFVSANNSAGSTENSDTGTTNEKGTYLSNIMIEDIRVFKRNQQLRCL